MKKIKGFGVWFLALFVLAVISGRILWLDQQYPDPKLIVIPKGELWEYAGYQFTMKGISMLDGKEYSRISGNTAYLTKEDNSPYPADRQWLVVASIQIHKTGMQDNILDLTQLTLENHTWSNQMDPVLFDAMNPDQKGMIVPMEEGESIEVICPFMAVDMQFTDKQWKWLSAEQFGLILNYYPEKLVLKI